VFVSIMAAFFLHYIYGAARQKNELIFLTVFLFFHGHFLFLRDSVSLYFFTLFFVFHFIKHQKHISLVAALLCCIIAFFMKVNTGIILILVFISSVLFSYARSMLSLKACLLYLAALSGMILVFSQVFNVDLQGYVMNSLPIIDAYNDAMGTFPGKILLFYAAAIILLTLLPHLQHVRKIYVSGHEIFLFLHVFFLLYILWKQSFVRYDGDLHTNLFFICSPFIILSTLLFSNVIEVKNYLYTGFFVACMISLAAFSGPHLKYIKGNVCHLLNVVENFGAVDLRAALGYELFPHLEEKVESITKQLQIFYMPWARSYKESLLCRHVAIYGIYGIV